MEPNATVLVSGEGVRLALAPAGVGSRTIAALIDVAIQFGAYIVLVLIDVAIAGKADAAAISAIVITELVLILAGYPIVMEWTTRGRTVGKLCMGLRVVRDDGGPIGFRQALVRGLAGLVLEKPGLLFPLTTIAGLVTISSSSREKRLGDMMAGTVVLNERSAPQALATPPAWVPVPLQPWVLALDLHRFDDRLALSTRQFISRAHGMSPAARMALGEDLRRRMLAVITPPPPPGAPTPMVLISVLAERRRRATMASQAGNRAPAHVVSASAAQRVDPDPAPRPRAEPDPQHQAPPGSPFAPPR